MTLYTISIAILYLKSSLKTGLTFYLELLQIFLFYFWEEKKTN